MAEARLKGKLTMDDSQFQAVLRHSANNAARFASTVAKSVGVGAAVAFSAATTAAVATSAALIAATKQAAELGGKFSDMRAVTGASVRSLVLLSHALSNAGVDGDSLGGIINKMQKSVESGGDAFGRLSLNLETLKRLSPDQQFMSIGRAIVSLKTPAEQTAAAMEIFGKSGGTLLAFFKDTGAIANSAKVLGSMPDILDRTASSLDNVDDKIANLLDKQKAFNVALGARVAPHLEGILDKLLKIDTARIGDSLGDDLEKGLKGRNLYDSMGNIARAFGDAMQIAFGSLDKGLTIALLRGFKEPIAWLEAKIEHAGQSFRRLTGQDKSVDVGKIDEKIQNNKRLQGLVGKDNFAGKLIQKNIDRLTAEKDKAVASGNVGESFDQIYNRTLAKDNPTLGNMNAKDLEQQLEGQLKAWTARWFPKTTESATAPEPLGPPMPPEMILRGGAAGTPPPKEPPFIGPPTGFDAASPRYRAQLIGMYGSEEGARAAFDKPKAAAAGIPADDGESMYRQPSVKEPGQPRRTVHEAQRRSKILGADATKREKAEKAAAASQETVATGVTKLVKIMGG